jgi:hypothetical protein
MAAISVRGLEADQLQSLKDQASRQGISLNRLVLQRLSGDTSPSRQSHADLDALAGTWSEQDEHDFNQAVAPLEQVDPDLWS